MKGLVFTEFFEMVEEQLGFELVDKLIERTKLATDGAYTTVGTYDHKELLALVGNLHNLTGTSVNDLLATYGEYLFPKLITISPVVSERFDSCFEMVAAVNDVIHAEVLKLYPDAELPHFGLVKWTETDLVVTYTSCRPFAYLARGLIIGCARHFEEQVTVDIENRKDDCLIKLKRVEALSMS